MNLQTITSDAATLSLILLVVAGLLLLSMTRIVFLLRTNTRLRESTATMERQICTQQSEILAARRDSNAWRGEMQRVFDAFRAEFSKRLVESEQRHLDLTKRQEIMNQAAAAIVPAAAPEDESAALPPPSEADSSAAMPPVPALSLS
ncbi:MAG: hypothetical protein IAE77_26865 [Prosthecobacter sp.]|jgi:hypothetical protein|uniref:hypothetical protein n=1 Tax=Prosthecobacter sp. TaxID=1965333 RepID=UPI0019E27D57|nr:hypothetical protein [Prosthecobacter sp.]MBE2287107.1 hypothetical protein [Prosthecobacter sp.]